MSATQVLVSWVFLVAYYYFVLRTYNTLGFRLFSLFFLLSAGICYGWYTDYRALKQLQYAGVITQAVVLRKSARRLDVRFTDGPGRSTVQSKTGEFPSGELADLRAGKRVLILYFPQSGTVYLMNSYRRALRIRLYVLLFPAGLFLLGIGCWIRFPNYRILPHTGTIYEYLIDDEGELCSTMPAVRRKKLPGPYPLLIKLAHLFNRP